MSLVDQGDRKIPGLKQGPALRQAGLCRMVEPGVVVEGPVGRVSRQDTQLMVEQDHRQGQGQRQVQGQDEDDGSTGTATDHEDFFSDEASWPGIGPWPQPWILRPPPKMFFTVAGGA